MTAERVDGELAAAVDDAVLGDVLADLPEAQPDRALTSATDVSSLYVRHRSGLSAHARRFLRDPRDVDEVVQETFLRLFLAIGEIETELQAIAFARRTLTNLCIDRYRAERRRPALVNLDTAPLGDLADDWNDDDPVLRAEDAAVVREALSRLSPLHRAALVKREIEEKPLPQIAAELDIPEESVKHLLFRARRALRRLLVGTSVEPGVDLSAAEVAALANRRAGAAMMRGANALVILVVGALVAAVGIGTLEGHTKGLTNGLSSGAQTAPGTTAPGARPHRGSHSPVATNRPHADKPVQAAPSTGTASLPSVQPVQQAPLQTGPTHQPTGGTFGASRSHFKLSGPLEVTGTPQVLPASTQVGDDGLSTTTSSSFIAPTDQGTFQLAQTVSTSAVGGDSVAVTPSFVVGNAVETPVLTGSTASISTNDDGTVGVNVVASAQPDPSTNAFQLTSMSVDLVLTPDLRSVVAETVVLGSDPQASAAAPTGASPPTTTPPPPVSVPPVSGGTSAGTLPSGDDTGSGLASGGQAATPGVLEISDLSDDRGGTRSFTTSGEASS